MMKKRLFGIPTLVAGIISIFSLFIACENPASPAPRITYTVIFNSMGGSSVTGQTVTEGAKASRPVAPAKQGFVFDDWYTEEELLTVYDFNMPVRGNITLYANWLIPYTVAFNSNGGSEVPSQHIGEGKRASRPQNPAKENFVFDDWYTEDVLVTVYDFSTPVTDNITLYAKWLTPCTVAFDSNGGSEVPSQYIGEGKRASRPQNPTKTGFGFAGWFSDGGLTIAYDFDTPVTSNITLYAKWDNGSFSAENIDDFGPDAAITDEFTVSNVDEWNSAVSAINLGGNGTATTRKNYIINIAADFAVAGKTETSIYAPAYSPTFSGTYITLSLRGKDRSLSLSSNGILLLLSGSYQTLIIRDLTLKGRSVAVDGENNSYPLIYVRSGYECVIDMKGNAAITGNSAPSYGVGAVRFPPDGLGALIMRDNAKIFGNGAEIAGVHIGESIIMRDNASIYNNFGTGIGGGGSLFMQDNASIYNNADSPPNPYDGTISWGYGVSGGDVTMQDNAKITGNSGYGVSDASSIVMRDYAEVSGNHGIGLHGRNITMQNNALVSNNADRGVSGWSVGVDANIIMQDNALVSGNTGGGVSGGNLTMTDYASVSNNTLHVEYPTTSLNGDRLGGAGVSGSVTMSDNTTISNNTVTIHSSSDLTTLTTPIGGGGVRGDVTMNGYAKITNNISEGRGGGVLGGVIMRDNTKISNNTATYSGGGVDSQGAQYMAAYDSLISGSAQISNNTAGSSGGGIFSSGGEVAITIQDNAIITNNVTTGTGGGVYVVGNSSTFSSTFIMRDQALIIGNTARNAGGLYTNWITTTMRDYAKVIGNTASGDSASGGGVYAVGTSSRSFTMQDHTEISGNTVTGNNASGGGLVVAGSKFFMQDNASVSDNKAVGNNSQGGGVVIMGAYYDIGTVWMRNNAKISGNSAQRGGGVYISYNSDGWEGYLCMQDNAEVSGNTASVEGGGIYVRAWTYFQISGGTVYGNTQGDNSNTVKNGTTSINGSGAALFKGDNSTTQYGNFSGENFTPASGGGNLATRDNTIRVVNGVLQP